MADASEGAKSSGPLQTILIAVVVALLTGSSSPFWWPIVFPSHAKSTTATPADTPPAATTGSGSGSQGPPPLPRPSMSAIMRRTNLSGGDIDNYGFETNTEDQCSDLCLKNDSCKAMTFVHHPDGGGGVCWLKNTVPASNSDLNMDSAVKLNPQ